MITTTSANGAVDAGPRLCSLTFLCDAPAEIRGYCQEHRNELNESSRRYREEYARSQRRPWLEEIRLPRRFWGATFADARPTDPIKQIRAYLDARGVSRGRAVIEGGPTGIGKTHAAGCLINELLPYLGTRMRFVLGAELVRELLDFKTCAEAMEEAADVRLLVIDDLQALPRAEGLALLEELLIRRHAEGLPLVVTTNLRRQAFEAAFGDRITDRLKDWGEFHELPGKSLRGR